MLPTTFYQYIRPNSDGSYGRGVMVNEVNPFPCMWDDMCWRVQRDLVFIYAWVLLPTTHWTRYTICGQCIACRGVNSLSPMLVVEHSDGNWSYHCVVSRGKPWKREFFVMKTRQIPGRYIEVTTTTLRTPMGDISRSVWHAFHDRCDMQMFRRDISQLIWPEIVGRVTLISPEISICGLCLYECLLTMTTWSMDTRVHECA